MIQKILNHRSESIAGGALIIAAFTLLGTIFGILRDALMASKLGATNQLDIYYASIRLPDFLYNIFILGAISAGFIPIFTAYLKRSKDEAGSLLMELVMLFSLGIGLLALIVFILAQPILSYLLKGFGPTQLALAVSLTRIMLIQPIILGLASIIGSVLQVYRLFLVNALAPVFYNIGIIIGVIGFYPVFGLKGLAYGVVLGALLNLLIQIPSFINLRLMGRFHWLSTWPGLKKMAIIMVPRTLSIIINQGYLLVLTFVATFLKEGSLAIFNLANNIQNFPQNIFALSFTVSAFPVLSQFFASQQLTQFKETLNKTIQQILFFMLPAAFFFLAFRAQIVRLLLGYGLFNWQATNITLNVLSIFCLGMIFQSLINLLIRTFFSQEDSHRPFWSALFSYSLGAVLCWYLGRLYGVYGLAGAFIAANTLYCFLLIVLLKQKIKDWDLRPIFKYFFKVGSLAVLSAFIGHLSLYLFEPLVNTRTVLGLGIQTLFSLSLGLALFLTLARFFSVSEVKEVTAFFRRKMGLKTVPKNNNNETHS